MHGRLCLASQDMIGLMRPDPSPNPEFYLSYLNPEEPTFYKEIIIRNPKKVGSSGLR